MVLCAGLNRSGSTWQVNAARALLEEADPASAVYASWIADYDPSTPAPVHLVKVHSVADAHGLDPDRILSSYRDLRAVAGSLVRMGWSPVALQPIRDNLDAYVENASRWAARADHVMAYEQLLASPLRTLGDLARSLDVELDAPRLASVLGRVEALTPNSASPAGNVGAVDRLTLLHDGHIGDRANHAAIARLPASVIADIEERYADWLLAHGYRLATG
jgi:hypothetical protein